jgi:predicted house-cleaning noncanonical NTP pyrophosphatase (MazG superfamily)
LNPRHLKMSGVLQGFYSVNPNPFDTTNQLSRGDIGANIKSTDRLGFYRFDTYDELTDKIVQLLQEESEFFSSMKIREDLGKIIEIADRELSYEKKAQKFIELIRE